VKELFSGSGPGIQTRDGCSVDLYRRLPYIGELDDVLALIPPGSSILELGCGTGRLCSTLVASGFRVTGVDESPHMLSHVPAGAVAVCSSIESLSLPQTFDVVLLPSQLINHPSGVSRQAFAACARRHLRPGGRFLLQRHNPQWLCTVQPGPAGRAGAVAVHVESVAHENAGIRITMRYATSTATWRQSFLTVSLSELQIEALLRETGFATVRWHGEAKLWACAIAH